MPISYDPDEYVLSLFSLEGAYESARHFFATHRDVTAVLTMSDMMAIGVIRALWDLGLRVPEDVSVSGFDGVEIGRYVIPSLTTVRQSTEYIARRSIELLCDMMEGGQARHEKAQYELIEGESLAPPRQA